VAEAVVDGLEAVEVEHQHGRVVVGEALGARQRPADVGLQQTPVGQAGEQVVQGLVLEATVQLTLVGDVAREHQHDLP
jgi:hypothetical protein